MPTPSPEILERIDYDAYQEIRYRRDMSIMLDQQKRLPVQLFHLGSYTRDAVHINVVGGGQAREVLYSTNLFEIPANHPARELPDNVGFAGFRIMAPDLETDWLAFMGASYFRTPGTVQSVRHLGARPRHRHRPADAGGISALHRILARDGIRGGRADRPLCAARRSERDRRLSHDGEAHDATTACMMSTWRSRGAASRARRSRGSGVAPLTACTGTARTSRAPRWRTGGRRSTIPTGWPSGRAPASASGGRSTTRRSVMTNTFVDDDIRAASACCSGTAEFEHYHDDSVFYDRRPIGMGRADRRWGRGAVQLVEIPTDDEIHDNIVAYWCPDETFTAGSQRRYSYRLSWMDDIPFPPALGQATATWTGLGGRPGHKRLKACASSSSIFRVRSSTACAGTTASRSSSPRRAERSPTPIRTLWSTSASAGGRYSTLRPRVRSLSISRLPAQRRSRPDRDVGVPVLPEA